MMKRLSFARVAVLSCIVRLAHVFLLAVFDLCLSDYDSSANLSVSVDRLHRGQKLERSELVERCMLHGNA